MVRIPPADQQALAQSAIFTYADGSVMARPGTTNRENVSLATVPKPVRDAVLAAEDHTFYSNSGVDPKSIARAALSNVRGGSQGGSTISQQYVKNVYNQRDRTLKRKVTEVLLAVKINREISKDAILERYLNTIYLGRGAYGIQAASQAYFHRDVAKLNVSQGAFLAGIINAPSAADPRGGAAQLARAQRRWGVVLDAMVKEGWLAAQARQKLTFPKTVKPLRDVAMKGQNGYLITMAEAEIERKLHLGEGELRSGGYKIVTTFDRSLIAAGSSAVKRTLPPDAPRGLQVGLTAIDPRTGAVRAVYGGSDYLKRQQNAATQDVAEAGATFTAFTLVAALKMGVSLDTRYDGPFSLDVEGSPVQNLQGAHYGSIDLVEATQDSVNTVFAQLNAEIGPARTREAAYAAGIPRSARLSGDVTNTLGLTGVHPFDLAGAYATFASGGIRRTPYVVESVTRTGTGEVLLRRTTSATRGRRAFPAAAVANTTAALTSVLTTGSAADVGQLRRPAAGQTGTSSSARSAWFVGYTPQLATAVSMYRLGRGSGGVVRMTGFGKFQSITGGGYPTWIWRDFMTAAHAGEPVVTFPRPPGGGKVLHSAGPDDKSGARTGSGGTGQPSGDELKRRILEEEAAAREKVADPDDRKPDQEAVGGR